MIGLVIVSHSDQIAEGVAELAGQMAPDVVILPAGGTELGTLGTSFDRVFAAIRQALTDSDGVVVLTDLGSATMVAATAIDFLEEGTPVQLADAPLVEGSVAAAAVAQGEGSLTAVLAAAEASREASSMPTADEAPPEDEPSFEDLLASAPHGTELPTDDAYTVTARLVNEMGLHARPAAQIASLATSHDAVVTVNGADARSMIALLGLGLSPNAEVTITATGAQAREAADAIRDLITNGFGEGAGE